MSLLDKLLPSPTSVEIRGKVLHCLVCGYHEFWRREARVEQSFSYDPRAICYECDYCGYLHWFIPK